MTMEAEQTRCEKVTEMFSASCERDCGAAAGVELRRLPAVVARQ